MKEFDIDKDHKLDEFLFQGMKLLEMDALGGSGSRGYGRVKFVFSDAEIQKKFEGIKPL